MEPIISKEGVTFKGDGGQETFARFTTQRQRGEKFQHFQNQAGQFIALGHDQASLYGQSLANVGFNPIAAGFVVPKPVVGIDESKNQISQGSDEPRDNVTATQNELNQLNADMDDTGVDTTGVDIGAEFESLKELNANLKTTSAAELTQIEEAGEAAGAEYDPLIAEAMESARMGQAKNIVATGRRGGFQRTRYAGQAALGPTVGDVGYEGAGGKLEAFASAYQRNIDALNSQKKRAVALAKAQARKAIQTGKQQDFANAKDMLAFARQINQDIKDADQVQWERTFKEGQVDRAEKSEERLQMTADFNIIKNIPFGESVTLGDKIFTGIHKENVEPFWTSASLVSLMKSLSVGETQELEDPITGAMITITGLKPEDINTQIFRSVNKNTGTETYTTIDKNTGEPIKQWKSVGTGETFKIKSGGGDGNNDKEKNKLFADLNAAAGKLRSGQTWGATFNMLFARYKTGDSAQDQALTQLIDSSLDKDYWSQGGAYQRFKESTRTKTVVSTVFNEDGTKTIIYSDGSRETF